MKKLDYDDSEALLSAFSGNDAVISTISTTSIGVQAKIIEAAVQANVKRFIPSDVRPCPKGQVIVNGLTCMICPKFGSDVTNDKLVELVPAFRGKREILNFLKSSESKGLSWTSIVNGPFFDCKPVTPVALSVATLSLRSLPG